MSSYDPIEPVNARETAEWRARAEKAERERDDLAKKVYVPGLWKCAKCGFTLLQRVLRASDGAVGVRDEAGENCPNDGSPLWRVSERDAGNELADRSHEYLERAMAAESERDEARRERDIFQRDRAALYDKLNGTPCAEIRWQQEREELLARAEKVERERDMLDAESGRMFGRYAERDSHCKMLEAELAAARALIARAAEAIEPFAKASEQIDVEHANEPDSTIYDHYGPSVIRYGEWFKADTCVPVSHGDFRRLATLAADLRKVGEGA